METIETLINNLKTKLDEEANYEALLRIANEIVSQLEIKIGNASRENNISIPTLAYQSEPFIKIPPQKQVELKDAKDEKSLNDILKEEKTEVSHILENLPVQDLRKAININDRFVFINELFAGDENLYEQSVKALNHISNLKEAENWIEKELKLRLGWNNETEAVQQFYKLIKRRYS